MNTFQLNSQNNKLQDNNNCFSIKESLTSIETYCKDLTTELEKTIKDKDELLRMYNLYKFEEILVTIENLEELIIDKNTKINNIKKIIWEMRGRILFNNN